MMWPFSRSEARADATVQIVNRAEAYASGKSLDPGALAIVEACASLWARCISSASVGPDVAALRGVDAPFLEMVGRSLAARGGFVAALKVEAGAVRLVPASAWDLQGDADPSTWRYRCDFIGPSGSMTETLPADGVLHFRINADSRTPWRGRSSLSLAVLSGELAARVERAMNDEMKLPIGRIATNTGTPEQSVKYGDSLVEGGFTVTALGQSQVAQEPGGRWTPAKYGPEPHTVMESLRSNLGRDLAAAFGVPSALFEPRGDGAGQRESWRRFWIGTIAPLGKMIQAELRLKLEASADVSFEALRASDEDGRSRAISRRAAAAKTLSEMGIDRGSALRMAGLAETRT